MPVGQQLGGSGVAAARWRQQWRQRDVGDGLAAAQRQRQQLGSGSLAAAQWRRHSSGNAQRNGGDSLVVARRWRQLGDISLAAAAWQ